MYAKKYAGLAVVCLMLGVLFVPVALGDSPENTSVWDFLKIERGHTTIMGGGEYISLKSNDSSVSILYGTTGSENDVKILASMMRVAGGVKIYDENGNLVGKRILRYRAFIGQEFTRLTEITNLTENRTRVKTASLVGTWKLEGLSIHNESDNITHVDFTVLRENIPYEDNASQIAKVAFHFHITVSLMHREVRGFPWYRYDEGSGVSLEERKNYSGNTLQFKIKYDKEIVGWNYQNPENHLALRNRVFWGIAGRDRVINFVIHRYGGDSATMDNHTYTNSTLPQREHLYRRNGRIVFTEVGQWNRIGKFFWESNVTVDGQNRSSYYLVLGGAREVRYMGHVKVVLAGIAGVFIYPVGNTIFQDPGFDLSVMYINFGRTVMKTLWISVATLIIATVVLIAALMYRKK